MAITEGVVRGIQLAQNHQELELKRKQIEEYNKYMEGILIKQGLTKDEQGNWIPSDYLQDKRNLEVEQLNERINQLKNENEKYKSIWNYVAAQTSADALIKTIQTGNPTYINVLPEFHKKLFNYKKISPLNPIAPNFSTQLNEIYSRLKNSPILQDYAKQAGFKVESFEEFKNIAEQNPKVLNKLFGVAETLDGKETLVAYPETAVTIGAKRFVADDQFNNMVEAFKQLTASTSKTTQATKPVYELKKEDINKLQQEIASWGGENGLDGIEPKNLKPEQKAKVFDYMWTKGIKLDSYDKKLVENINKMVALADSATKLTSKNIGLIDKKLFDVKKYLGIDPDSAEAIQAYNLIKSTLRHALFGSQLTEAEIKSFNDAFADLKQSPGVVFTGLKNMYKQIASQLQAIVDTNDPYITTPLFGGKIDDVNNIIERLDGLAKNYTGKKPTPNEFEIPGNNAPSADNPFYRSK